MLRFSQRWHGCCVHCARSNSQRNGVNQMNRTEKTELALTLATLVIIAIGFLVAMLVQTA